MEHEDEPNATCFDEEDVDMMEEYDNMLEEELEEGGDFSAADMDASVHRLCKPFSRYEPDLDAQELAELDMLADQVEIGRLKNMSVLVSVNDLQVEEGQKPKELSTKFVRTWRDKVVNVRQETPTVVTCIDSNGASQRFGLGKVLPVSVMDLSWKFLSFCMLMICFW